MDNDMQRKYILTNEKIVIGNHTLTRIKAVREFDNDILGLVLEGSLGGFVETEANLSHSGTCWICHDAKVYGDARVSDNAVVMNHARMYGAALVSGNACVHGCARIHQKAQVKDEGSTQCKSIRESKCIRQRNRYMWGKDIRLCPDMRRLGCYR